MTLPARVAPAHKRSADTPLPLPRSPRPDAARLLALALDAELSPKAFMLYAAVVVRLDVTQWLTSDAIAAAAGMTGHQGRRLLAELVRAGLVRSTKVVVRNADGVPSARSRYAVAVTA